MERHLQRKFLNGFNQRDLTAACRSTITMQSFQVHWGLVICESKVILTENLQVQFLLFVKKKKKKKKHFSGHGFNKLAYQLFQFYTMYWNKTPHFSYFYHLPQTFDVCISSYRVSCTSLSFREKRINSDHQTPQTIIKIDFIDLRSMVQISVVLLLHNRNCLGKSISKEKQEDCSKLDHTFTA